MSLPVWLSGPMFLLEGGGPSRGFSVQRGLCSRGSLSGVSVQGGYLFSGVSAGRSPPPPRQNQKSGWYASYWNAFLLLICYSYGKSTLDEMCVLSCLQLYLNGNSDLSFKDCT